MTPVVLAGLGPRIKGSNFGERSGTDVDPDPGKFQTWM